MTEAEIVALLTLDLTKADAIRVGVREKTTLEFKRDCDAHAIAKSLKTIGAFANNEGGWIVFGVSDKPRNVCGCDGDISEADLQDQLTKHLYPVPIVEIHDGAVRGRRLVMLKVLPALKPPVVAIKEKQTNEVKNSVCLSQGVVYYRRAGQTKPCSGEEFAAMLDRRDEAVRNSILSFIKQGAKMNFEHIAIADFRKYGSTSENVNLWVPESAARELQIIDRAKLVETNGAPAYEIRGTVNLTIPSDKDPRKPLLPAPSARALRPSIIKIFWPEFPWSESHLRKATTHLGFWKTREGDNTHTGFEHLGQRPIYYEEGRAAVHRFANRNPAEFVEVIGSQATKSEWRKRDAAEG